MSMFVRLVARPNDHVSVRIVENKRINGKMKQKNVCCIGHTHKDKSKEISRFQKIGEEMIIKIKNEINPAFEGLESVHTPQKKKSHSIPDNMVCLETLKEKARVHQGIEDVFGKAFEQLELHKLIGDGYKMREYNTLLKEIVLSRLSDPSSKRKSVRAIERDRYQQFDLNQVYRMMDKLYRKEDEIKARMFRRTLSLLKEEVHVLFFDVTTLYFESFDSDTLRLCGYSKDNKVKETQVVLALMTSVEGLPVGYELFPGNTYEGKTLIKVIEKIEKTYNILDVSIVADRAMFTRENLQVLHEKGTKFIVAAKLKTMSKAMKSRIVTDVEKGHSQEPNTSFFSKSYKYEGHRLIISYRKERAYRDKQNRETLIERLKSQMHGDKIYLSSLIKNTGSKKYLKINRKNRQEATLNQEKIDEEARWDGIHGVITNHSSEDLTQEDILERYKGLWQIETAFRVNKHDLRMRPIYHWAPRRIRAHILICYIAYSVLTFIKFQLKQKKVHLSFERLRDELKTVQYSIVLDKTTNKRFILPSNITSLHKQIYKALNIKFTQARFLRDKEFL